MGKTIDNESQGLWFDGVQGDVWRSYADIAASYSTFGPSSAKAINSIASSPNMYLALYGEMIRLLRKISRESAEFNARLEDILMLIRPPSDAAAKKKPEDKLAASRRRAWEAYVKAGGTMRDEKDDDDLLEKLSLSVRARNACRRANVKTVSELASKTFDEMMSLKNCGETTVNELRALLAKYNLNFAGDKLNSDQTKT